MTERAGRGHAQPGSDVCTDVHENTRPDPVNAGSADPGADPELGADREFDLAWARSSPIQELSAHGRSVQRRLDTPPPAPVQPSAWKRLRFSLYRLFRR